jgi:hypothetical protein
MTVKAFSIAAVILAASGGAAWADNACLVEGQVYGEAVKDCTQTSLPIPAADYAAQCKENDSGPLKATVLKTCPAKAQAACVGLFGQPATAYYYSRSPQSLADTKKSCIAQRGKWVDKP